MNKQDRMLEVNKQLTALDDQQEDQQEMIDELQEAVLILEKAAGKWNLQVSQDDEFLVCRVLDSIKASR